MTEDNSVERERFNAYDAFKQVGWRIDALMDQLDHFNSRIRSNTARISRLKARLDEAPEEVEEEVQEEERAEAFPLFKMNLHELSPAEISRLLNR